MSSDPHSDETGDYGLGEGIRLYHRAKDHGEWASLMTWFSAHPDLAAELARHIKNDGELGERLRFPTVALTSRDRTGEMIGEFELLEEIGRGAMGVVYRAFDTKVKRDVALKMVRGGRDLSARELARVRIEAETVASLDHENIVPILTLRDHDGLPYLVMKLMTGGSLAEWIKKLGKERCSPKRAAEFVRDIANGVHHAHQRGLIHRDLKPGNILLDDKGRPHVADFGLARRIVVDEEVSDAGLAGTVAYMAPEQARNERNLTTAVDIHAIGVILFELLTGGVPYGGADIGSILRKLTDETEPVPPISFFRRDVPTDLEAICMRCLNRQPADRYHSAEALADALDRFLNGEPQIDAPRRSLPSEIARVIGRRIDSPSFASWPAFFWGLISLLISQITIQAAVLTESPAWVAHMGWGVYFGGWLIVTWQFGVTRTRQLTRVERSGIAVHIGMMLGGLALVPASAGTHGGYLLPLYPGLLAVIGVGIYFHGTYHWGLYYVLGSGCLLLAACMPLFPMEYWPAVFAIPQLSLMVWVGFVARAIDRKTRPAETL